MTSPRSVPWRRTSLSPFTGAINPIAIQSGQIGRPADIDLGALIVYGHHPHVLQGIERYKKGLILYSLGNFFLPDFIRTDGVALRFPRESRRTVAILCDVDSSGVKSFSIVPLEVRSGYRVHVLQGRAAARAARSVSRLSIALETPDYTSLWQSHHSHTERKRRREEDGLRIRGEAVGVWRQLRNRPITGSLRALKGRHVTELLRLIGRTARLLMP